MTRILVATTLALLQFSAHAESPVTYVGEGRYTCRGNNFQCAQIDQNNRRESDYRAQQYQRDKDRAQDAVDRSRRDEERRNDLRRNP